MLLHESAKEKDNMIDREHEEEEDDKEPLFPAIEGPAAVDLLMTTSTSDARKRRV